MGIEWEWESLKLFHFSAVLQFWYSLSKRKSSTNYVSIKCVVRNTTISRYSLFFRRPIIKSHFTVRFWSLMYLFKAQFFMKLHQLTALSQWRIVVCNFICFQTHVSFTGNKWQFYQELKFQQRRNIVGSQLVC